MNPTTDHPTGRINGNIPTTDHRPPTTPVDQHPTTDRPAQATSTDHPTTRSTVGRPTRIDRRIAEERKLADLDRAKADRRSADRERKATASAAGKTGRKATIDRAKTVGPLLMINAVAVYGQISYAMESIAPDKWDNTGKLAISVAFAAAVEIVALYIGWHAHDALMQKAYGSAASLRRWSYLLALLVGGMNYSHFAGKDLHPTAAAVAFGLLSSISPWMWGLHTRREQHVQLLREDRIDEAGVVFSTDRRREFPIRSWLARRWALDHYVTDPRSAWEGYRSSRSVDQGSRPTHLAIEATTDHPTTNRQPSTDHRPVIESTARPTPTDPEPTTDRAEPIDHRPTRPAIAAAPTRPPTTRPARHAVAPTAQLHAVPTDPTGPWSSTAIANAATVRDHYGPDRRPTSVRSIRNELGWSADRARDAYDAYAAGADLPTDHAVNE